jgi:hemerythrin-like domain-containing protein
MIREMLGIAEGILQDLHNDHSEVDALLGRIMDSKDGSERSRLFTEMKSKLLPHLKAEQEVLYQRLETGKSEESRRFGNEGTSEHQIVEQQIQKMSSLGNTMSDQWTAELKVLQELIEHHVGEEESTGFSCARDEFGKEELEAMSQQFQTRKAQLGTGVA